MQDHVDARWEARFPRHDIPEQLQIFGQPVRIDVNADKTGLIFEARDPKPLPPGRGRDRRLDHVARHAS